MLVSAMKEDDVHIWATAPPSKVTTSSASTVTACLSIQLQVYKPWLDAAFIDELGGRAEMSAFMQRSGFAYKMLAEKPTHRLEPARRNP